MGLGYQCEVNHRYGGHDGHSTEWEISVQAATDRVKNIQALSHPALVAFHFYSEKGGRDGFAVLQACQWSGDAQALVLLLVAYLMAWPDEEAGWILKIAKTA